MADNPKVKQRWFAGVHADVGGGYAQCGLSDITLQWMMAEAAGLGLTLLPGIDAQLAPDPHGLLHDSVTGILNCCIPARAAYRGLSPEVPMSMPA